MSWPRRRRRRKMRAFSLCRRMDFQTPAAAMHSPLLRCMWEIRRELEENGLLYRAELVAYLSQPSRNDSSDGETYHPARIYQALKVLEAGGEVTLWRSSDPYRTLIMHVRPPWTR